MSKNFARFLQSPQRHNAVPSCATCGFLEDCGGLDGGAFSKGCFSRCETHCFQKGCDLACPSMPQLFSELIEDVGGICLPPQSNLRTCTFNKFSPYIAQIDHGSGRDRVLSEELVAIPIHSLLRKIRGKKCCIRYDSPASLRRAFKLAANTAVVVTCIAPDRYLEEFWFAHIKGELLVQLASLQLRAITVPNFSFMLDVPRTNSLYNFGRMFRVAERASSSGLATIFHLQASNERDWSRWYEIMRDQPSATCVALEYQTGASHKTIGDPYYAGLYELQQRLGRALHPIVMAGAGRLRQLHEDFLSFTIIDSTPFMKTVHRQSMFKVGKSKWKWHTIPTASNESLSDRLQVNISAHRARLLNSISCTSQLSAD